MEKYSATLGCNQRKVWSFSERSLLETCKGINRTLATGTLSRDVCPHGPKIDSGYFLCTMYAWGLCPFLGMDIYSEKSLAPRNLSGINLGTTPRRHHTRGYPAKVSCLKDQLLQLANIEVAPSFSSVHSFGTQVRSTAFSPNVIVEHLHFESSQSCCSENRPC